MRKFSRILSLGMLLLASACSGNHGDWNNNFTDPAATNIFRSIKSFSLPHLQDDGEDVYIHTADLDEDGHLDLITCADQLNKLRIYLGQGDGTLSLARQLDFPGRQPADFIITDINNDKHVDLVVTACDSDQIISYLGDGQGNFTPTSTLTVGTGPTSLASADLNNDGKIDLVVANQASSDLSILLGDGSGVFSLLATQALDHDDALPWQLVIEDFNDDGNLDLAVTDNEYDQILLFAGLGDGSFTHTDSLNSGAAPTGLAQADFNHDGLPDLVCASSEATELTVFLNNGSGFTASLPVIVGPYPLLVYALDINNDGHADLVSNLADDSLAISLGNGNGSFQPVQFIYTSGWGPWGLTPGDFNGDGLSDFSVSHIDGNDCPLDVFLQSSR